MNEATIELYLFRHGESYINVNSHLVSGRSNESPLTQHGLKQAHALGLYLREHGITPTTVYSSPALRTMQTATSTLEAMNLSLHIMPIIDDDLQELDQGDWVGLPRNEVYSEAVRLELERLGKDFKAPGGESMNEVGSRMLKWAAKNILKNPSTTQPQQRIFAFTHGVAIRCLASTLHSWTRLETYQAVTDNASINLFTYQDGRWQMKYIGMRVAE